MKITWILWRNTSNGNFRMDHISISNFIRRLACAFFLNLFFHVKEERDRRKVIYIKANKSIGLIQWFFKQVITARLTLSKRQMIQYINFGSFEKWKQIGTFEQGKNSFTMGHKIWWSFSVCDFMNLWLLYYSAVYHERKYPHTNIKCWEKIIPITEISEHNNQPVSFSIPFHSEAIISFGNEKKTTTKSITYTNLYEFLTFFA